MSGINSASSSSSNSSFLSETSSSSSINTSQTPSILNLLNFSRQFSNPATLLNSLNTSSVQQQGTGSQFPFYLFSQFQPTSLQSSVKASSEKNKDESGLSEDLIKHHLTQLIKNQENRESMSQNISLSHDIEKNMIYE